MSRWQAIVFDLDDTLYAERDYVLSGFHAVAAWAERRVGIPAAQGYAVLAGMFEAGVRGDTFDRWLEHHGCSSNLVPEMVQAYRQHVPVIDPFPGIIDLLDSLRGRVRLGIVSDGYLEVQQSKLAALGLAKYFDSVVFSDLWGREFWKPHVLPFINVLEGIGVSASKTVYVADNCTKDFAGARKLGMSTVWARHSCGDYVKRVPPSPIHMADQTTDTVDDLRDLLLSSIPL